MDEIQVIDGEIYTKPQPISAEDAEASLRAVEEQIIRLTQDRDRLTGQIDALTESLGKNRTELAKVKDKPR